MEIRRTNIDEIFYYHPNHLGSTSFVTDQNQTITQGFLYAPFGEITTEYNINFGNNVIPKYAFNAKELDEETGMYYYEARYYAPPMFISRDPLMSEKPWLTPYHYCSNNPIGKEDPTGMMDDWYKDEDGNIKWTDCKSQKEMDKAGIKGTYLGLTYHDKKNSTYYPLYGQKGISYDANNRYQVDAVNQMEQTDNSIIRIVNSIKCAYNGSRNFWDKHNDMINLCSDIVSAGADLTKNAPLKKMLKPIGLYATANSVLDYVKSIKNRSWNMSTTISLAADVSSLFGGFYGNIISLYLNGINFASKKGAEAESSLRNYFSPLTPNNFYSNCYGY